VKEKGMRSQIVFPREVLLVEVERWCRNPACGARTRVALTKAEARAYTGFECGSCERRNDDALVERDIPEWWEELKLTSLDGVRETRAGKIAAASESGGVVARMSDAWKSLDGGHELAETEGEEGAGDSF
jgi:hypothetical protein